MSIKVFVVLFICSIADIEGTGRDGWPGYTFHPALRGWLKLHSQSTDYQDARITCHMEDALLAAEWNADFKAAIYNIITGLGNEEQSLPALYSGAQVKFSDGVYRYVKGEPTLSLGPNGVEGLELCIAFFGNGTTGEVDCQQHLPFVCFAPVPACGEENLGYKFDGRTGHCYKYNTQSKNWTEAYKACRKEGAHLAVVNSDVEAQVLKELFPSGTDIAVIGFYYWKPSTLWWTVEGQTIQQAGFDKWRSGEPTNGAYYSGFLHREGKLYSHQTSVERPFICEKTPALQQT